MLFWRAINPSLGGDSLEMLRQIRELAGYSQQELADESGVSQHTISEIELGRRKPQGRTLRKLAEILGVEVADLLGGSKPPLGPAPPSPQPTLDGALEEERRARWDAEVQGARQLRKTARTQMQRVLKAWRRSKGRGEPYATRRKHLDEMGALLQEAYGAYLALGNAYVEAALTQGGSEASVPSYLGEETREANDFYVELFGLVRSAGLGIRTGDDAAAAKQAADDEAAAEHVESETRTLRVEENDAA
jgi:transcriptional regulator with XRE-family HTH domain